MDGDNDVKKIADEFYNALLKLLTDFDDQMPSTPWGGGLGSNSHGWADRVFDDAMRSKGYVAYPPDVGFSNVPGTRAWAEEGLTLSESPQEPECAQT